MEASELQPVHNLQLELTPTGRPRQALKGKKVHKCNICEKTYTRNEHLNRHRLTHLPRSYHCDIAGCRRLFTRPDLLKRHRAQHMTHALTRSASTPMLQTSLTPQEGRSDIQAVAQPGPKKEEPEDDDAEAEADITPTSWVHQPPHTQATPLATLASSSASDTSQRSQGPWQPLESYNASGLYDTDYGTPLTMSSVNHDQSYFAQTFADQVSSNIMHTGVWAEQQGFPIQRESSGYSSTMPYSSAPGIGAIGAGTMPYNHPPRLTSPSGSPYTTPYDGSIISHPSTPYYTEQPQFFRVAVSRN